MLTSFRISLLILLFCNSCDSGGNLLDGSGGINPSDSLDGSGGVDTESPYEEETEGSPGELSTGDGEAAYAFEDTPLDYPGTLTITLRNIGDQRVRNIEASGLSSPLSFLGGEYPGTGGTCGSSLNSGSTCTLILKFLPTTVVSVTQTLLLEYSGGESGSLELTISGESTLPIVTALSGGGHHQCALFDNQKVKCWGQNDQGQVGIPGESVIGDEPGELADTDYLDLGDDFLVADIQGGMAHTCALSTLGVVKCWGDNAFGQRGIGSTTDAGSAADSMGDSLSPVSLGTDRSAEQISVGAYHSCALLDNGAVKCWGRNNRGQLGRDSTSNIGDGASEMGDSLGSIQLNTAQTVLKVAAGATSTCALLADSSLKCWGHNASGQLGIDSTLGVGAGGVTGAMENLSSIGLGTGILAEDLELNRFRVDENHACFVTSAGKLKCWGENSSGQLGLGDTTDRANGVGASVASLTALDFGIADGKLVTGLSLGASHSCVVLATGVARCWGDDFGFHDAGAGGVLGQRTTGNIGDSSAVNSSVPASISLGSFTVQKISSMADAICVLSDSGAVKCWGSNDHGELGAGDTDPRGATDGDMGSNLAELEFFDN